MKKTGAELETRVAAELRESAETSLRAADDLAPRVAAAAAAISATLARGGRLLIAGNGGSAADADHMAAELVGRFRRERSPAPAIALVDNAATLTAIANDFEFSEVFSRQVRALGEAGDALLAISTSGASANVIAAVREAAARNIRTIALTGSGGGDLAAEAEIAIIVDSASTARVQEVHLAVMHGLCEIIDAELLERPPVPRSGGLVLTRQELLAGRAGWREAGKVTVWTNGCFDLLHVGHVRFLSQARALGDILVVGVNSDASVREIKGPERPLVPAEERAEVLAALASVDAVTIFPEPDPITILAELEPDIHCKGGDYGDAGALPESATVLGYGGEIRILDLSRGNSTTGLIERARSAGA